MTTKNTPLVIKQGLSGLFKWSFATGALILAGFGVLWIVLAIVDESNTGIGLLLTILNIVVFVFPAAAWIYTIHIKVVVTKDELSVRLWPLPATKVRFSAIQSVGTVHVNGLTEYWGWGIRGTKKDLFYGLDDGEAVHVQYKDKKNRDCSLKIMVADPKPLVAALSRSDA